MLKRNSDMGIVLTIDQGNSAVKYNIFDSCSNLLRSAATATPDLEAIPPLADGAVIHGAVYASVAGLDIRFIESLRCLCSENLLVVTPSTPVPLSNNYATPSTLGADRLAAAVGAATLCPATPVLIADAGSALTCDLLGPDASYCGGTIAPGVGMRLNALHTFTSRLPEVVWDHSQDFQPFPLSTDEAMTSGAVRGVVAQIADAFEAARKLYPDCRLLMTGGDAPYLIENPLLKTLNPLCQPALVAVGLNSIFRYNETFD